MSLVVAIYRCFYHRLTIQLDIALASLSLMLLMAGFSCAYYVINKSMEYKKTATSWDEQADLLISRGMIGDRAAIVKALQTANYYRLSGYWYPFRIIDPDDESKRLDEFRDNTTFDAIWDRYIFDRELRLLVLDAIERIEVATRSQLMYHHAHAHGPFGYATDQSALPHANNSERTKFLKSISKASEDSADIFSKHFKRKYGQDHLHLPNQTIALPAWMLCEVISFGTLCYFYKYSSDDVRKNVADSINIPTVLFESWLQTLRITRNTCAHHSRLWNKKIHHRERPQVPTNKKRFPDWHTNVTITNDHVFGILTICKYLLDQICPDNHFASRFTDLIAKHPNIPLVSMGFPENWKESPLWNLPD